MSEEERGETWCGAVELSWWRDQKDVNMFRSRTSSEEMHAACRDAMVSPGSRISSFQVPHFFNVGPSYLFPNCFRTGTVVFPLPSSPPPSLVVGHTTLNIVV